MTDIKLEIQNSTLGSKTKLTKKVILPPKQNVKAPVKGKKQ